MDSIRPIIGIIALTIYFVGSVPYFKDVLFGSARPNRVTWFGWALLAWAPAIIQTMHGADASVAIVYSAAIVVTAVFLLSLYRGVTKFSALDIACLILGLLVFVIWLFLDAPTIALAVNLIADFLFAIPTIVKTWRESISESRAGWLMGFISTGLILFTKTNFDFINSAYPFYLFALNATMFLLTTGQMQRLNFFENKIG